jgi:hypothetical protein
MADCNLLGDREYLCVAVQPDLFETANIHLDGTGFLTYYLSTIEKRGKNDSL